MSYTRIGLIAGVLTIPCTIAVYYVLGLTFDSLIEGSNVLRQWMWFLIGLIIVKAVLAWIFRTGQFRASSEAKLNVRDQIYKHVIKLGPGLLNKRRTGEIANVASEGVEYLDFYFAVYSVQIWVAIATPILLVATIFWIDWAVGLALLAGVPATPLFVASSARGFRKISARNAEVKNRNSAQYLDSIQGMSSLKMFNGAGRRGEQLEADTEKQRVLVMRLLRVAQLQFIPLELGFALLCTAMAMGVSIYRYSGGFMTPGEGLAVVLMSLEFSRTLLLIGDFFFAGALGREVADRIKVFLDEKAPIKVTDSRRHGESDGQSISIEFRDVTFAYPNVEEPTLKHLSFELNPNETVAMIGKSGSGKTTIVNLMLRTLDPQSGEILFDGVDEKELSLEWMRKQIGLVPQDPYLFFGTVRDNLHIAKQDATDEELMAALKDAELEDFVETSPAGLDTMVGDQGLALSGGQAQRLAIARALLKDAPVVVLDEPTSQIDVETETLLNRALERLCANKTVLLIAHRLSTIERADRIIVLEDGTVAESGTRQELLARGGIYASMIRTKQAVEHTTVNPAAAV
ncbi:MAG: ABC transporter ATP-binding protein/permease [Gammaproteobacteria bacterium]|nr:ABC transporter ATP-binding protein/permease [Gammaproteobacteria bacterium]